MSYHLLPPRRSSYLVPTRPADLPSWAIKDFENYAKWLAEIRKRPDVRSYLIHGSEWPFEDEIIVHSHGNHHGNHPFTEEEEEGGKKRATPPTPSIVKAPYNYNATAANRINPSSSLALSININSSYEDLFASLIASGYLLPSSIGGITPEMLKFLLTSSSDPKLTEEEDDERKRLYIKKLVKDGCEYQGFDVDSDAASFELQVMDLPSITKAPCKEDNYDEEYKSYVEFAIKSVKSNVHFVRIVKANWQVDNSITYYITFEAYDPADALITKTYQTRLVRKVPFENSVVDIFRLKPSPAPQCQDQDEVPSSYEPMDCDM